MIDVEIEIDGQSYEKEVVLKAIKLYKALISGKLERDIVRRIA